MIYIIFGCFLMFFVIDIIRINSVAKHDQVLFPFCQLRRDIISFLYENVFEKPDALSREEYISVRKLLDMVSLTIHNYNEHKTVMFNVRKMAKHLRIYRKATKVTPKVPANQQIQELHGRFIRLLAKAFLAYTPLIRSELALKLIVATYRASSRAGYRAGQRRAVGYVISNAEQVRADARGYNFIKSGAVA